MKLCFSRIASVMLTLAFLSFRPVVAQVDSGAITGIVRDSSGAILPGARVVVANSATNQTVELETNAQGIYVSPPLRPGDYVITLSAQGFEKSAKRIQLDVSQRAAVDFDLKVGAMT